ncbi:MAG TPA: hypothetical protein PKO42_07065 [Tenuifilaceae bacterium]|nr:hypothetical protein [Tenuifilaceae bacterium]
MSSTSEREALVKAFEKRLSEASDEAIIGMLEEIRESGESYMIPSLVNLLFATRGEALKQAVMNFMVDVKIQAAAEYFVSAIQNNPSSPDLYRLVPVCWQSRLDFSSYIDLFLTLLCNADLQTSIEAFSVIENSLDAKSDEEVKELTSRARSMVEHAAEPNKPLVAQLVKLLENFQRDEWQQL